MQFPAPGKVPSSAGLLLLDSGLNPVFVNLAAAQILAYPQDPQRLKELDRFLARKIRSVLLPKGFLHEPVFPFEIRSGRRVYLCRSFEGESLTKRRDHPFFAVLFERTPASTNSLTQTCERFSLTLREQQVLEFLSRGLTSKEIAGRMQISPNTVKAFLRLIMSKMGVSTRSGIVGKVLDDLQRPFVGAPQR